MSHTEYQKFVFFLHELFQCESCTYIYVSYVSRYLATNWIYLFVQWTLETWYINISPHILSMVFHVVGIFNFKHHFIGIQTVCWVIQLFIYLALILIYNTLERYILLLLNDECVQCNAMHTHLFIIMLVHQMVFFSFKMQDLFLDSPQNWKIKRHWHFGIAHIIISIGYVPIYYWSRNLQLILSIGNEEIFSEKKTRNILLKPDEMQYLVNDQIKSADFFFRFEI